MFVVVGVGVEDVIVGVVVREGVVVIIEVVAIVGVVVMEGTVVIVGVVKGVVAI